MQPAITRFESLFNGPYPFTSDGVVVGRPSASFEEEMQTMITFAGGQIDTDTLWHENMHQWWGDHVTEANYNLTFFKEGLATFGEFLFQARTAAQAAGGLGIPAGRRAFQRSLVAAVQRDLPAQGQVLDRSAVEPDAVHPVRRGTPPTPGRASAYVALRQILGHRELRPCPAADPAAVRRRAHHRGAA